MKYKIGQQIVKAVYSKSETLNPLIDALPESLDANSFFKQIKSAPPICCNENNMMLRERKQSLNLLHTIFVPLNYMYYVYNTLFQMFRSSYCTLSSRERVARINAIFASDKAINIYGTQAQSGALLGTPGVGKTSTVKRCLKLIPQVIEHEKYLSRPFFCKQVIWLFVDCPSDANQKAMAYNIVHALDRAVESNHLEYLMHMRGNSSSAVAAYIKVLCLTYHIGLIVIDEIQNVVVTAHRTNRVKPLIRFLTELTNDSSTAIYFTGTTLAEKVFQTEEYLRRRTRGPRLLPFKPDGVYRDFLQNFWSYQFTQKKAELTDKLANQIYDYSGGIPAYIVKLFEGAQMLALTQGVKKIDSKLIVDAAAFLSIQPPKEIGKGTFLSDFKSPIDINMQKESISNIATDSGTINYDREYYNLETNSGPGNQLNTADSEKRLYTKKRGRKKQERDEKDLIVALNEGKLKEMLLSQDMMEGIVLC